MSPFLVGMRLTGNSSDHHFDQTAFYAWGGPATLLYFGFIV